MTAVMVGRVGFDLPTDLHQQNMSGKARVRTQVQIDIARCRRSAINY